MKPIDRAKLVFALLGVAIWGYGLRIEERNLQWLGIGVIAIAFIIRFLPKGQPPGT